MWHCLSRYNHLPLPPRAASAASAARPVCSVSLFHISSIRRAPPLTRATSSASAARRLFRVRCVRCTPCLLHPTRAASPASGARRGCLSRVRRAPLLPRPAHAAAASPASAARRLFRVRRASAAAAVRSGRRGRRAPRPRLPRAPLFRICHTRCAPRFLRPPRAETPASAARGQAAAGRRTTWASIAAKGQQRSSLPLFPPLSQAQAPPSLSGSHFLALPPFCTCFICRLRFRSAPLGSQRYHPPCSRARAHSKSLSPY